MSHDFLDSEKVQKKPTPNVPLWYVDYFEFKKTETQKTQEELSTLP